MKEMQATPELYQVKLGTKAHSFQLLGADDKEHILENFIGKKALVIVFMCNHCPYVLAYVNRINELAAKYLSKKVQFLGINANDPVKYPQDSFENMKRFVKEKNIQFPYLYDETQEVARAYHGLLTPHVMVFDEERKLVYNGGIDDNWEHLENVTKHYLDNALHSLTEAKKIAEPLTPCVGCSIKWK